MIDTHAHLTDERLAFSLDDVLLRAKQAGVKRIISIGVDVQDSRNAITLTRQHDIIRATAGVHPNHAAGVDIVEAERSLRGLVGSALAIGETGIDLYWKKVPLDWQIDFFHMQLRIASETGLAVVIHSREAVSETLTVLKDFRRVRAVFHSFTGSADEAKAIIDHGAMIGFTGPLTYKKNESLRETARTIPRDRVLVETDAPYLSPEPVRHIKTNEPSHVMHTANMLAKLWGVDLSEVDRLTSDNARVLFGSRLD
jgi:TatD DNase family protein